MPSSPPSRHRDVRLECSLWWRASWVFIYSPYCLCHQSPSSLRGPSCARCSCCHLPPQHCPQPFTLSIWFAGCVTVGHAKEISQLSLVLWLLQRIQCLSSQQCSKLSLIDLTNSLAGPTSLSMSVGSLSTSCFSKSLCCLFFLVSWSRSWPGSSPVS